MKRLIILAVVLAGMLVGSIYVLQPTLPLSGGAAETYSSNSSGSSDGMNLGDMNLDGVNFMGAP